MTTTTNIKLSTPAQGSNVDTWSSDPINNNSGILDNAFGSVTSKALTNVNVSLTATEAQAAILRFSGTLTGNVTINVSAIIKSWYIDNLTTGTFVVIISGGSGNVVAAPQGESTQVYWDGTNCKFINLGRVGSYWDYAGATVPIWVTSCTVPPFLLCDGSSFSAGTYPYLNTILGSTTLPDARGRNRIPLDGGTGRITTAGSGVDGATRFAAGGAQNVTLATADIPSHTHALTDPGHTHSGIVGSTSTVVTASGSLGVPTGVSTIGSNTTGISISNTGGGGAHNNVQPTFVGGITMILAG